MITQPVIEEVIYKDTFLVSRTWLTWFMQATNILIAVQSTGTTAQRPLGSKAGVAWVGRTYFDATLNKPIWIKSVGATAPYTIVWVDATGAIV